MIIPSFAQDSNSDGKCNTSKNRWASKQGFLTSPALNTAQQLMRSVIYSNFNQALFRAFWIFMSDEMKALAAELLAIELDLMPSECCGKCGQVKAEQVIKEMGL